MLDLTLMRWCRRSSRCLPLRPQATTPQFWKMPFSLWDLLQPPSTRTLPATWRLSSLSFMPDSRTTRNIRCAPFQLASWVTFAVPWARESCRTAILSWPISFRISRFPPFSYSFLFPPWSNSSKNVRVPLCIAAWNLPFYAPLEILPWPLVPSFSRILISAWQFCSRLAPWGLRRMIMIWLSTSTSFAKESWKLTLVSFREWRMVCGFSLTFSLWQRYLNLLFFFSFSFSSFLFFSFLFFFFIFYFCFQPRRFSPTRNNWWSSLARCIATPRDLTLLPAELLGFLGLLPLFDFSQQLHLSNFHLSSW